MTVKLTDANFDQKIQNGMTLVDFCNGAIPVNC